MEVFTIANYEMWILTPSQMVKMVLNLKELGRDDQSLSER